MIELASAARHVVAPVAFILRTVWPHLDAKAVSNISALLKLALVDRSVGKDNLLPELKALLLQQQVCTA